MQSLRKLFKFSSSNSQYAQNIQIYKDLEKIATKLNVDYQRYNHEYNYDLNILSVCTSLYNWLENNKNGTNYNNICNELCKIEHKYIEV